MKTDFYRSATLEPQALGRKYRLETDPASRTDPMVYLPDMERIESDIMEKVLREVQGYDPTRYTAHDVERAFKKRALRN